MQGWYAQVLGECDNKRNISSTLSAVTSRFNVKLHDREMREFNSRISRSCMITPLSMIDDDETRNIRTSVLLRFLDAKLS
jgi:hypothetical protein